MIRILFFLLSFIPHLLLSQLEYNYYPKEPKAAPASLAPHLDRRIDMDLSNISQTGIIKQGIKKIYKDRYESLIDRVENEEFLFDDIIYPHCKRVLNKILTANPKIPVPDINFLISRSLTPNATCLGEGTIVINLGLLSRLESEGQLAFAICHELAHYIDNHVNDNIANYVEEINSDAYKHKLSSIQKQEYNRNAQAIEFLKQFTYQNNRHSRYNEIEADSLGLIFLLATDYNPVEAIRLMAILDKVDEPKYPENIDFKLYFGNLSYPYKDYWGAYEIDNDFFYSKDHVFDWDNDSLKTHPQCEVRLQKIAAYLAKINSPEGANSAEESISGSEKFQQICDFELIHTSLLNGAYGLSLFRALSLLQEFPENTYLHAIVGFSLSQLYIYKKNHELGKTLELTGPRNHENYDRFLHFVRELRLKDLAQLAYAYLDNGKAVWKEDQFYLFAYILSASISGNADQGQLLVNQYLNKFPDGTFVDEINEITFTP